MRLWNYWKQSIHCIYSETFSSWKQCCYILWDCGTIGNNLYIVYCETFSYMGKTFDASVSNIKERSFRCSVLGNLGLCLCGAQGTSRWQATTGVPPCFCVCSKSRQGETEESRRGTQLWGLPVSVLVQSARRHRRGCSRVWSILCKTLKHCNAILNFVYIVIHCVTLVNLCKHARL